MRYNWDLDELKTNYTILEGVLKNFDDEKMKIGIKESIALYKNMLKMVNKHGKGIEVFDDTYMDFNINDVIEELMSSYNRNNFHYLYPLLNSFFVIKDCRFDAKKVQEKIIMTNDELISITKDFFEDMTTPKIAKKFNDILDKKDRIQICYERSNSNYAGLALVDDILHNKYIYISRKNEILDLHLLPHEAFHYIFNDENVGLARLYNTRYLSEVEGLFANILFADYYNKIAYKDQNILKDYNNSIYQEHIEDLVIRNTLLDCISGNKKIRLHKLNKFLKSVCENSDDFTTTDELAPYLDTPQYLTMTYSLSYLVAIDLYYKYLQDREEAFYNLECIKYDKETNQVISILENNGITFMKDNYTNLKKYIKK